MSRYAAMFVLLGAFLGACMSTREPAESRFFTPSPPKMAGSPGRVIAQALAVRDFRVASHLNGDRIAARTAAQEIEYYVQHRWAGPLDRLVSEEIRRELRNYFTNVSEEVGGLPGELTLSGSVEAFEEEDEASAWFARAAIDLTLRDSLTGEVLWRGYLESRKPARLRHPQAVAAALGEALGEIVQQAASSWWKMLSENREDR